MPRHIAIVGAGIMGRILAWHWLQHGASDTSITLFNDTALHKTGAASFTAAGMLTPYSELADADSLVFNMGQHSLALWPKIADSLSLPIGLQQAGSIVVSHASDGAYRQQFEQQLQRKLQQTRALSRLDKDQLHQLEPELTERFDSGIYLENEAWLDSHACLNALANLLQQHPRLKLMVTKVLAAGSKLVCTQSGVSHFDLVYDCRGLGAKPAVNSLRGVRGELIWLRAPNVKLSRLVRLIHPRYRLYVVPRPNDIYVIGATQIESEFSGQMSVRSALELLSAVYSIHSGFAEAEIIKTDTNLRPAFADNLPKILVKDGLIRINGLFRHGYLLAPALAELAFNTGLKRNHNDGFSGQVISSLAS